MPGKHGITPMSKVTWLRLKIELDRLHSKTSTIQDETGEAFDAGGGSWHDNFCWEDALRTSSMHHGRIIELEFAIQSAKFIDEMNIDTTLVSVGTIVTVKATNPDTELHLIIMGPYDADWERHIVNYEAPLVQAIIGHKIGDICTFTTPDKKITRKMEIMVIESWQPSVVNAEE